MSGSQPLLTERLFFDYPSRANPAGEAYFFRLHGEQLQGMVLERAVQRVERRVPRRRIECSGLARLSLDEYEIRLFRLRQVINQTILQTSACDFAGNYRVISGMSYQFSLGKQEPLTGIPRKLLRILFKGRHLGAHARLDGCLSPAIYRGGARLGFFSEPLRGFPGIRSFAAFLHNFGPLDFIIVQQGARLYRPWARSRRNN